MLICITNRKLCQDDFLNRIDQLAQGKPTAMMLREKDLERAAFQDLAIKVKEICDRHQVSLIINQNLEIAKQLKVENIQVSIEKLRENREFIREFEQVGVSVHSVDQAKEAEAAGADYLIAGHVFPTECKKGLPARGLRFLKEVCDAVKIPVWGVGGIDQNNYKVTLMTGAKGVCVMSEAMTCRDPAGFSQRFTVGNEQMRMEENRY